MTGGVEFHTTVNIRFAHADLAGVMFFASLFPIVHGVVEEFVVASGIGWQRWFADPELAVPLRRVEADYLKPLRPGRQAPATLRVGRISRSSVELQVELTGEDGQPAARVQMLCVFVRLPTFRVVSIPPDIRSRLEGQAT